MFKKIIVILSCLALLVTLALPVFASDLRATSADLTYNGQVFNNLPPVGVSQNKEFPVFAQSNPIIFSCSVGTYDFNFIFRDYSYTLRLDNGPDGSPVIPYCVYLNNGYLIILCRARGSSATFEVLTSGSLVARCFSYYRFLAPEEGRLSFESYSTPTSGVIVTNRNEYNLFPNYTLYVDTTYPVLNVPSDNPSFSIPARSGERGYMALYSQPCLTRYGYWVDGWYNNIFPETSGQPLPVMMYRASTGNYIIVTCRFADFMDFRLSVVRNRVGSNYTYSVSTSHVYSTFSVDPENPYTATRLSTNNSPGVVETFASRFDVLASSYPITFEGNINNIWFWSNPDQFGITSNSPNYIPPLSDSVQDFDDLEGGFLENAGDIFNGFTAEMFDGLTDQLSDFGNAFAVWGNLVNSLIADKMYIVFTASISIGVIMVLLNLFIGLFKPSGRSPKEGD